jgi:hypothetical protein
MTDGVTAASVHVRPGQHPCAHGAGSDFSGVALWSEGVSGVTGVPNRMGYRALGLESTMRKIVVLIAAAALILGCVEVWAGGSWITPSDDAAVFVISNAL